MRKLLAIGVFCWLVWGGVHTGLSTNDTHSLNWDPPPAVMLACDSHGGPSDASYQGDSNIIHVKCADGHFTTVIR